jgi:hypothetical protein
MKGPLLWKDISFTRGLNTKGDWHGGFLMEITFRHLKTSATGTMEDESRALKMILTTLKYKPELSLPHRMLIILIRRDYLVHRKTIESLMTGSEYSIAIKQETLDKPDFLAASERGLGSTEKPASMDSFFRLHLGTCATVNVQH